jgi:hypothetical protein
MPWKSSLPAPEYTTSVLLCLRGGTAGQIFGCGSVPSNVTGDGAISRIWGFRLISIPGKLCENSRGGPA